MDVHAGGGREEEAVEEFHPPGKGITIYSPSHPLELPLPK
jgi:hypothetical protein